MNPTCKLKNNALKNPPPPQPAIHPLPKLIKFDVFGPRQADDSPYTGVIAIFVRELLQGLSQVPCRCTGQQI